MLSVSGLERALWREADAQTQGYASADLLRGVEAVIAKKRPEFEQVSFLELVHLFQLTVCFFSTRTIGNYDFGTVPHTSWRCWQSDRYDSIIWPTHIDGPTASLHQS